MPKVESVPEHLRPFQFHGLDLSYRDGDRNALAQCPFCLKEGKFSILIETGQWRCLSCNIGPDKSGSVKGGNAHTFVRLLWEHSDTATRERKELSTARRLLREESLAAWGVCRSITTGDWIVPGYAPDGRLMTLYRYCRTPKGYKLLATPTLKHHIHGLGVWDQQKPIVYVCEGPWDGIALYEVLSQCKRSGSALIQTTNADLSLYAEANIIAVPGANTFFDAWLPLFAGKIVNLMFDNDHPRVNEQTGAAIPSAGYEGMKRAAEILAGAKEPPSEIRWLKWGEDGYDPSLPSGFDVRDSLSGVGGLLNALGSRITAVSDLLGRLSLPPETWKLDERKRTARGSGETLGTAPCSTFRELVSAWRKAMLWNNNLNDGLAVILAAITSTKSVGDQLWIKLVGPASSGKSTLAEAIAVAKDYVVAKSTIRGFHSGSIDEEGNVHSLIDEIRGKTLVIKDGDTLLTSPNKDQILAEGRDLYDTVSRASYRNKASRDYTGVRMTWILCGTASLRSLDQSELGERFLDYVVMDGIDDDVEDDVCWRVANRAERNLAVEADGKPNTHQDAELTYAMQLTGGYVEYLRLNAQELLAGIVMEDDAKRACMRLGKFVAYMRARPSAKQEENAEREFAARLVSQIVRLAKCLAAVLNRPSVDGEVLSIARRVALDTSRGQTLDIVKDLYHAEIGYETRQVHKHVGRPEDKVRHMLYFLQQIGAVELFEPASAVKGLRQKTLWRLTPRIRTLYSEICDE